MKVSFILLSALTLVSADQQNYGRAAPAAPVYGAYPQAPAGYPPQNYHAYARGYPGAYEPPASYGYSPYAPHHYNQKKHYEDYVEPVYPPKTKPYAFISIPEKKLDKLNLPHLGDYHCFLVGSPWTQCGRRSLTSYFLDQCMVFYYMMSSSVDGICGGKPPKAQTLAEKYSWSYGQQAYGKPAYGQPAYGKPAYGQPAYGQRYLEDEAEVPPAPKGATYPKKVTPKPTPKPAPVQSKGYGGAVVKEYQKERCLQRAYVSITTATVMCLTENMIRIKYIEHYSKFASQNPIEGPMLYLRKLHSFIDEVLKCTGKSAANNYPNLWMEFRNSDGRLSYNPNAPYEVDSDTDEITLTQYTNGQATGLSDYTVSDEHFLCSDVKNIGTSGKYRGYYRHDSLDTHYSYDLLDKCKKSEALDCIGKSVAWKECKYVKSIKSTSTSSEPIGPKGKSNSNAQQFVTDMSLRGLYDAVHYTDKKTSLRRPLSIAEIAVSNAGVLEQPILEGFGIMYFCAFYACKANNGGDINGKCLPDFDCENDWKIPSSVTTLQKLNTLSQDVNKCLSKKWITNKDIIDNGDVRTYKQVLDRSYVCMAEHRVVNFFKRVYGSQLYKHKAWDLVYFRHLAVEKCYVESVGECADKRTLYQKLVNALQSIVDDCKYNKEEYYAKQRKYHAYNYQGYGKPAHGQPAYGQRASGYGQASNQYGYNSYQRK